MRRALLTVFSDFLRYQNMLCRYDTYALKCQDIFAVHGFPVGLVQCENSLLGVPGVGAGAFRTLRRENTDARNPTAGSPLRRLGRGKRTYLSRSRENASRLVPVTEVPRQEPEAHGAAREKMAGNLLG